MSLQAARRGCVVHVVHPLTSTFTTHRGLWITLWTTLNHALTRADLRFRMLVHVVQDLGSPRWFTWFSPMVQPLTSGNAARGGFLVQPDFGPEPESWFSTPADLLVQALPLRGGPGVNQGPPTARGTP